ncbi:helix-turn-helix domain-containing protein [Candidatus Gracilibacteria bacterium]|nr:helix-turn-helix domain-containing protein [Candidatus Gracilibacteria bacterium]
MKAKKFLTPKQQFILQQTLKTSNNPQLQQHCLMLLLRNEGKTYQEIAKFLDRSYRTVAYWCAHGDPDNLETLLDRRSQGNYRKVTPEYKRLLFQAASKSPVSFGYKSSRWTNNKLAQHLASITGILISSCQIGNILRQGEKLDVLLGTPSFAKQPGDSRENV